MKRQWFNPQISLGNVIQLFVMLVMAVGAYYKFDARLSRVEEMMMLDRAKLDEHDTTLRQIVNTQTRLSTLLEERAIGRRQPN